MSDDSVAIERETAAVVICRCEEVLEQEVAAAMVAGATTVNDVKRWTRAGMGVCQGVYCIPAIVGLLAQATGAGIATLAPMTARAPVRPIPLTALADLVDIERAAGVSEVSQEDQA